MKNERAYACKQVLFFINLLLWYIPSVSD